MNKQDEKDKSTEQEEVNCGCNDSCEMENENSQTPNADNLTDESFEDGDNLSELAEEQANEWKDKYMRLSAEFDNYRKRTLKEKMELVALGGEGVMKTLLGVIDDMDRAMDAINKSVDVESLREGVDLIYKKLMEVLSANGVSEIDAVGKDLDTDYHDAVAKFAAGEDKKGKIIDVVQKGYMMKDKVIRYSKVVVGE